LEVERFDRDGQPRATWRALARSRLTHRILRPLETAGRRRPFASLPTDGLDAEDARTICDGSTTFGQLIGARTGTVFEADFGTKALGMPFRFRLTPVYDMTSMVFGPGRSDYRSPCIQAAATNSGQPRPLTDAAERALNYGVTLRSWPTLLPSFRNSARLTGKAVAAHVRRAGDIACYPQCGVKLGQACLQSLHAR